jgi:hypothetical protein
VRVELGGDNSLDKGRGGGVAEGSDDSSGDGGHKGGEGEDLRMVKSS